MSEIKDIKKMIRRSRDRERRCKEDIIGCKLVRVVKKNEEVIRERRKEIKKRFKSIEKVRIVRMKRKWWRKK